MKRDSHRPEPARTPPHGEADSLPADGRAYAVDWANREGAVDELLVELDKRAGGRRRRRAWTGAGMAVMLVVVGIVWRSSLPQTGPAPSAAPTVSLPTREVLPDGSVVELNGDAKIATDFTASLRRVSMLRGEAHFQVAKDAQRPFVVQAGRIAVRAVGTAFSVTLHRDVAEILVTEGKITVGSESGEDAETRRRGDAGIEGQKSEGMAPRATDGGPLEIRPDGHPLSASLPSLAPTPVEAGNRVVVDSVSAIAASLRIETLSATEIAERLAWRVPRLEFSGTPLAEAVAMFNRYNDVKLVLAGRGLDALKVSGFLRADKTDTFLRLLESDFGLIAERRGANEIVLSKTAPK